MNRWFALTFLSVVLIFEVWVDILIIYAVFRAFTG